jgi:hypothetical protein
VNPDSEQFDEYRTLGDEPEKEPEMVREHPDETVHLRRRYQLPRTMSTEEYYAQGGYAYGKRKKK